MNYLMIENPGVAAPEAFTILGATTKRGSSNSNTIGVFGSGNKHAVSVCLRHNMAPKIFCSNLRLEFGTRQMTMGNKTFDRVQVKYGGKDEQNVNRSNTEDLGFVLDYGAADWLGIDLALREFVSNAIDRAVEEDDYKFICAFLDKEGISDKDISPENKNRLTQALKEHVNSASYAPWNNVSIKIVEEKRVRAKSGFTRVFIPMNQEVYAFYENLGKWFLHFSEPELLKKAILPKTHCNRNLSNKNTAVIYRRGVRVREVLSSSLPSLFDYNLEDLKLDESRQVDDYTVKNMAAFTLSSSDVDTLKTLFLSFEGKEMFWEHQFEKWPLYELHVTDAQAKHRKETWSKVIRHVYGEAMIAGTQIEVEMAQRKGHKAKMIPIVYALASERYSTQTVLQSLTIDDREGREIIEPLKDAQVVAKAVWDCMEAHNMTKGQSPPKVFCFKQIMSSESMLHGFQRDNAIYLNAHLCTDGGDLKNINELLILAVVEETAHYITGAADFCRDFQTFAFTLAAKLLKDRL